jgi:hypothetical protein
LRHLFGVGAVLLAVETSLSRRVVDAVHEYLSGAISGLNIFGTDEGVEDALQTTSS